MPQRKRRRRTFTCPTCGADVPEGAAACPECGSDDETGWSAESEYDEAYLPDPDDEHITYESAERMPDRKKLWVIVLVAALIVLALLWGSR